jgi:ATP adenylyltransferase
VGVGSEELIMQRLWTPWRMQYIATGQTSGGCVLCEKVSEASDRDNYLLYRAAHCFLILNLYPYNNGHIMVVPYQHTGRLHELTCDTLHELMELTERSVGLLETVLHPNGFNIGMNLSRVAGAGIEDHVHMHIVPRWNGDTNYMSILADTRVMPETLPVTYERLRAVIDCDGSWFKST